MVGFFILVPCCMSCYSYRKIAYYSQRDNYVIATGILVFIKYNDDNTGLYLGFSDLQPKFSDNAFKIVGDNLQVVQRKGIDEKLKLGDTVSFTSAPAYFGDGYVMPIVQISLNGEELLSFEEGYQNLLDWLKK